MSEMPAPSGTPAVRAMPRVWKTLLIASLALNLLIGGAAAARFLTHEPRERFIGASYAQLIPRRFLGDLDKARRAELLGVLQSYRTDFRDGRKAAKIASTKLADALEKDPFVQAAVDAAIQDYAGTGNKLVARGAEAALDFVSRLTPDERRKMAERLRQRAGLPDDDGSGDSHGG